jgi:hypothetical protein
MTTFSLPRIWPVAAFFCALVFAGPATAQTTVKPEVSGNFIGNGKNAAIRFVVVQELEPFNDKKSLRLIFTEKDPTKAEKPEFDASFGKLGSSLILSVDDEGEIFGCEVAHSAHKKQGFGSLGKIKMEDFKVAGGNVSGHVGTGGEQVTFGEKWEVDLKFAAPLPEKLRHAPASKPAATESAKSEKPGQVAKMEPRPAVTGPQISARKLPLPKDAANVEFKEIVNQIQFSSARPVAAVAKEFSASLKEQGWKDAAGSLMGKTNAILRREQGAAKLTIMVQPAGAGSTVRIMTEGLDWSAGVDPAPATPKKPGAADDAESEVQKALKEAQKAIEDALKGR